MGDRDKILYPPTDFMSNILCEVCLVREKTCVRNGSYCCDFCIPEIFFFPYMKQTEYLAPNFPNESVERSKELNRRIVLPDKRTDGVSDYYVGRISESGKIQDKMPDISP